MIRRGEIYLMDPGNPIGSEIQKVRPVLVVSRDESNLYANTITILPITGSVQHIYPFEVFLKKGEGGGDKDAKILSQQIRTVDKRRLIKGPRGIVDETTMNDVERAMALHLAIPFE